MGRSTGISIHNICSNYQDAANLIAQLIRSHKMPILVEEYIQGYEVEYIIFGNRQSIRLTEEVKLIMDKQDYFEKTIWGFETKKLDDTTIDFQKSNLLSENDKGNLQALFQSFDKVEFMRIDGRFHNGNFTLIELSPDCYLGDDCAFYYAFQQQGIKYEDMFRLLIPNAQVAIDFKLPIS
ncbi:hypothetical protein [Cohnella cellulosilytica]|uniref:hypothetical protein n=1 Tax=Cohnella cellulosilytica TaxID=986710 RepID=UPI0036129206